MEVPPSGPDRKISGTPSRQTVRPDIAPQHLVIRASAGTGKTFQLSSRYLGLLAAGVRPDTILAATFTRKAAGEILTRILRRIADAACSEEACAQLADTIRIPAMMTTDAESASSAPLTTGRCQEMLVSLIRSLHRLRIGTLDSLFQQIASHFSLELGLPPGWNIVEQDATAERRLRTEAIRRMLESPEAARTLMHRLTRGETSRQITAQILSVVNDLDGLARESTSEAWAICPEIPIPDEKTLDDATRRLECIANNEPSKNFQRAYHKIVELVRGKQWGELLVKNTLIKKSVVPGVDSSYHKKPIPSEVIDICVTIARFALSIEIRQVRDQTLATRELLDRFREIFDPLQAADRLYRFSDIPRRIGEAVSGDGDGAHRGEGGGFENFRFRLDAPIDHLLLDEFQDTSPLQWSVLRPMAERVVASPGGSFFCVGDRKQAIYGWRGGVAAIFDRVQNDLKTHLEHLRTMPEITSSPDTAWEYLWNAAIVREDLNCCWRCSPVVLDVVNRIFAELPRNSVVCDVSPEAAEGFTQRFGLHVAAPKNADLPGYVCVMASPEPRKSGNQVTAKGETEVAIPCAARLVRQLTTDSPGASIGVLMRRNKLVGRMIHELRRLGLTASEEGGNPLTDSPAVEVILSMFSLVDHPGDRVAAYHVAESPLGPIVGLTDFSDDKLVRHVAQTVRERLIVDRFGEVIHDWRTQLLPACDTRDAARLDQLVELALRYDRRIADELRSPRSTRLETGLRCDDFVAEVKRLRVDSPGDAAIRVMTIHQAKGLEFDIVVLAELGGQNGLTGRLPTVLVDFPTPTDPPRGVVRYLRKEIPERYDSLGPVRGLHRAHMERQVTESLSLLYVAMTRAVHALYMIVPPTTESCIKKAGGDAGTIHPANSAGVLLAGLIGARPVYPEEIVFELGLREDVISHLSPARRGKILSMIGDDAAKDDAAKETGTPKTEPSSPPKKVARPRLMPSDPMSPRAFEIVSPSSLEGTVKEPPLTGPRITTASSDSDEPAEDVVPIGAGSWTDGMGAAFSEAKPYSEWAARRATGRDRGTLFHRWFERLGAPKFIPETLEALDERLGWCDVPAGISPDTFRRMKREFLTMIREPTIAARLRCPTAEEVARRLELSSTAADGSPCSVVVRCEMPFARRIDAGRILSGVIDRITFLRAGNRFIGAEILDHKTDWFPQEPHGQPTLFPEMADDAANGTRKQSERDRTNETIQRLDERALCYRPQLAAYATAIGAMYGIPPEHLRAEILFTSLRRVVPIWSGSGGELKNQTEAEIR